MKKLIILCLLFLSTTVFAHECWIACQKYVIKEGQEAILSLNVGENFEPEKWKGKIQWFKSFSKQNVVDILPLLDTAKRTISFTPQNVGTYLLALQSEGKFIRLEANKFNAYLQEDGLLEVLAYRKQHNEMKKEGTEFYERCNKTLLQVGNQYTNLYKKKLGLPLEIVLSKNPYQNPTNMQALLLFEGKPLPNHLVKVWYRLNGNTTLTDLNTNEKGLVSFPNKTTGTYMLSAVNMVANKQKFDAQWHSYWANYTYGY